MKKGIDFIGVGVGGVIINNKKEILLFLRNKSPEKNYWTIPGGSVEFGEKIEDAILREVYEEVGVSCEIIKFLGVKNHILPLEKTHWIACSFLLKIKEGIPNNMEPQSHSKMQWFDINNLPENTTLTTHAALNYLRGVGRDIK